MTNQGYGSSWILYAVLLMHVVLLMLSFRKNAQLNVSQSLEAPPLENDDHFWQRRFYDFNILIPSHQ